MIHFHRNTAPAKRLGHEVIRYRGTVQHFVWFGPLFIRTANRAARRNVRNAARARLGRAD